MRGVLFAAVRLGADADLANPWDDVADVAANPSSAAYQYEIKVTRQPGMRAIMR